MAKTLLIDNYDSFTYNLYQYLSELGANVVVARNDQITLGECQDLKPERIVISPGPGDPDGSGVSLQVIQHFAGKVPVLGVCLGHQSIYQVFGGTVDVANEIWHGKTSKIHHDGRGLFKDIPQDFHATRYHSLVGTPDTLPDVLEVTARTPKGLIMGVRHKTFTVVGVQFHPESIASQHGRELLQNFLCMKGGVWK